MAKKVDDSVLDAALAEIATGTNWTVTSAEPANYAGIAAVTLASTTVTAGLGSGDYTAADGTTNGRKVTMTQKTGVSVTGAGTQNATHLCIDDGVVLLYVTTVTSQAVTNGNTITIPAWEIEFADPT